MNHDDIIVRRLVFLRWLDAKGPGYCSSAVTARHYHGVSNATSFMRSLAREGYVESAENSSRSRQPVWKLTQRGIDVARGAIPANELRPYNGFEENRKKATEMIARLAHQEIGEKFHRLFSSHDSLTIDRVMRDTNWGSRKSGGLLLLAQSFGWIAAEVYRGQCNRKVWKVLPVAKSLTGKEICSALPKDLAKEIYR